MNFSAHNILLNNNKKTLGNDKILLSDSPVLKAVKKIITSFIIHEHWNEMTAVDLGCMEGGYSVELARMGFNTLGIDARKQNLLRAIYVKGNTCPNKMNFVLDDVRNLSKYGSFDVALCFGLLYHMDKPAEFLKIVSGCTKKILILHSFYAPEKDTFYWPKFVFNKIRKRFLRGKFKKIFAKKSFKKAFNNYAFISFIQHIKGNSLSQLTTNEGYNGRWFYEFEENSDRDKIESSIDASYNNSKSFWLCKKDLIKAIYDAGFTTVYEQLDDIGDLHSQYPSRFHGRGLFVAIK